MVLDVLTVRLGDEQTSVPTTRVAGMNFQQLLELFDKKQASGVDVEVLVAECQSRLLSFVNLYGCIDMENVKRLEEIQELITDGDHYEYAMNELRGILFNQLHQEFSAEFNKRRAQYTDQDWRDDVITTGMKNLLVDLCKMANIFVKVLKENPIQIPNTLGTVITAANEQGWLSPDDILRTDAQCKSKSKNKKEKSGK